ncbi:MAG: glycosyltransferase family 39 protein [Pirellulaceae bacterium]|nr:glycosyltransferase family 39 protein [Pirellulaceae bacterium]
MLNRSSFWVLALVVFLSLWFGLSKSNLWDRDEPRNARCAVEMLERNDWVVPTFNDQLRTHKPILLYWLQMSCIRMFGETDFAARASSAFMASLAILATYWLGRKLIDVQTGFWSAAALATSLMFVVAGRAATPDACLVATSTLGVVALVLHWQSGSQRVSRYAVLGYVALGFAILAKGPVGIIMPLMVVGLWALVQANGFALQNQPNNKRYEPTVLAAGSSGKSIPMTKPEASAYGSVMTKSVAAAIGSLRLIWLVIRRLKVIQGVFIALAISAPWYIWVGLRTDGDWLYGFFVEHNLGRAMSAMEGHRGGLWFYPAASLVGLFPWSLMLLPIGIWTARHFRKHSYSPAIQLGIVWLAVYIVLFSLARTKLPSYITPSYPGAALLIGGFMAEWANRKFVLSKWWLKIAGGVFAITAAVFVAAILYLSIDEKMPKLAWHSVWGIGFLFVAVLMIRAIWQEKQVQLPWAMLAATVAFTTGLFAGAGPTVGQYRSDLKSILSQQNFVDDQGKIVPTEWISLRSIEPSWVYYLRRPIVELPNFDPTLDHDATDALERLAKHLDKPSGRLIVQAERAHEIQRMLVESHQLPTRRSIAFKSFLKSNEIVVLENASPQKMAFEIASANLGRMP